MCVWRQTEKARTLRDMLVKAGPDLVKALELLPVAVDVSFEFVVQNPEIVIDSQCMVQTGGWEREGMSGVDSLERGGGGRDGGGQLTARNSAS